jgi:16S rRNA (guanine1207-N2)-methyltransferase
MIRRIVENFDSQDEEKRVKPEDVYFKKNITFNFWKQSLVFRTSQELFSSHDIDLGTQFLLRSIVEAGYSAPQSLLDLGCGYGPLGLTLKKIYPGCAVHMVDRDALAVEYASQNAGVNGLEDAEVYGSLGYDDVKETGFDMIVSNIPGKAGEPVIARLLLEAGEHLRPGGMMAVVIVSALDALVSGLLENTPGISAILKRSRSGHSVYHFRWSGIPSNSATSPGDLEQGVYQRSSRVFQFTNREYSMQTAFGLPEFDSLDYRSELLMKALAGRPLSGGQKAAVFNPGQGHTAVLLWNLYQPQKITLIDRDLLALRYTRLNLSLNNCPFGCIRLFHQVGMNAAGGEKYDLIAGTLREEEGEKALELALKQAAAVLSAEGTVLVSAGSTAITRLADYIRQHSLLRIEDREKWKGNSLLVLSPISCSG